MIQAMIRSVSLALLLSTGIAHASGGDAERGRDKSVVCQACHGTDGNGIGHPEYPLIAGQYEDYLIHSMRAYKTGERENLIMQGFMDTLSDQDIADLAAWFASQKGPLGDLRSHK